jgi:hypothetical protein
MSSHSTPRPTKAPAHTRHTTWLKLAGSALFAALLALVVAAVAHARTYVIYNCPSAPIPNANPGPWQVYGATTASKTSCSAGAGDFIGPLGSEMAPNSGAGVSISAPSGETISTVSVYWYEPQSTSGANTYAQAWANSTLIGQAFDPVDHTYTPDNYTLPTGSTSFILQTYCSQSDGPSGCVIGSAETPELKMFGSQITIQDATPPSGSITGGALADGGTLTGTQGLNYTVSDPTSGVRLVKLLIDGNQTAENSYTPQCPYENFLACPASITDTLSWNTATVTDGQHFLQAIVEDAAQNTTLLYQTAIATNNAPKNLSPPALTPASPLLPGAPITVQPGSWAAPPGAGNITYSYQWEDCDSQTTGCQPIPSAQTASYTPTASDVGRTLRALVTAADNDGTATQPTAATSTILAPQTPPSTQNTPATSNPNNSNNSTPSSATGPQAAGTAATGTANGTPASETATLTVAEATKRLNTNISSRSIAVHRSFQHRALELAGRLTNNTGQPISGATLDVIQQISGSNTPTLLKHATTGPDGRYTLTIPAGPSRHITIAYQALTSDAGYTATATAAETVAAGVQLTITPLHTSPTGTIELTGVVYGPIPPQGALVQLHVFYHDKWLTIRSPRTNKHGHFHIEYQFEGAIGGFPFQVEIPAGQANFPYTRGYSNKVTITTR